MSRSRYEPVPQADTEIIDLASLGSYNYNTAVPNSIPDSPPPSFHSSQSIASAQDLEHDRAFLSHTPRPVSLAPSLAITSSTDALLVNLHKRVERLEESLGRLLIENDKLASSFALVRDSAADADAAADAGLRPHSNCCVTFDSSVATERAIRRGGSNCCVTFRSTPADEEKQCQKRDGRWAFFGFLVVFFMIILWTTLLAFAKAKKVCVAECPAGIDASF